MPRRSRPSPTQTTIYEAGASSWECHGNVSTVPRTDFDASCSLSESARDSGLRDLQAYVLAAADASVSLEFGGTALAIYGITFARDACEAGDSPARATLEVAGPPATDPVPTDIFPDPTTTPVCSAPRYPAPVASCAVLARWTGLDGADRHRVSLSTKDGRRMVVLSAQVGGADDFEQSHSALVGSGAATVATDAAGTTTVLTTQTASSGTHASLSGIAEGQIRSAHTTHTGNTNKEPSPSSVLHGSSGLFSPIPAAPSARGSRPSHSSAQTVTAAVTIVILVIAIALAFGLYRRYRRSITRLRDGIAPYGTVPEGWTATTARSTIVASIHQKGQLLKCASEAGPGDASGATSPISSPRPRDGSRRESSLRQAVEGTGLTAQDLLGLLDRLRAQESRSPRLTWRECESDVAPPGYNG